MNLYDILLRVPDPEPWSEGDNIPWHEAGFSARMLKEHLTQEHDWASRRFDIIDRHVGWIDQVLLQNKQATVLDLGCGPGFYASRLTRLGHTCTGIDYSPASLAYARQEAQRQQLAVTYVEADLSCATFGTDYDLAMLIYGELNIFRRQHATDILDKAYAALVPGGVLLLEPHTMEAVVEMGKALPTWFAARSGLFSDAPHLVLTEARWHPSDRTTTIRHYVVDALSAEVARFAQTFQSYDDNEYRDLLARSGFDNIEFFASLEGGTPMPGSDLFVIVARKPHQPGA